MSDGVQKLGIQLAIEMDPKFASLVKSIEEAFSKVNLKGAIKQMDDLEKAAAKAKSGLDFSKLTNAQWTLLENGAKNFGVVLAKSTQNVADLNKNLADTINHQRMWAAGAQEVNGKMIPATKAMADQIVRNQKESSKAHDIRIKELTDEQKKLREIALAYQQKANQEGLSPQAVSKTTESAYKQREKELSQSEKIASTKARILDKMARDEESYVNKLAKLRDREESILAAREKSQEKASYAKLGTNYMRSYTDDGNYPVNGGWARKSAVNYARTRGNDLNAIHAEALVDYNALINADKVAADKFWNFVAAHNREGAGRLKQELKEISKDASDSFKKNIEDQQKQWNSIAGTSGVKYKQNPYGEGFVRASVDTSYVDNLRQVNKAHAEYLESVKKSAKGTSLFGESIGNAIKHLVEFYTIRKVLFAVSGEFTEAVSSIIQFNQAIADTAAITNASSEGVRKFALAAYNISQSTKMDLRETMKMVNLLAQSGVSEKDVPIVSKVTAMFATGTGSSAENAVRVMTTSLNVWNIEAERAAVVADTLAAGLNSAKLEVNELSTVFNYLAPIAHQAGFSIQQTTGIIATMSQMGVKASTIGTGVSQVLTRLMAPTAGVKSLFKAYSIDLDEVNPRLHKFSEIVRTIQNADGGKGIPIQDLLKGFGNIAGRSMAAAKTAGAEYFEEMERNVSLGNASMVAYSKAIEGADYKLNVLKQTFTQFIGSWGTFNAAAALGYETMMSLVRGLASAEGKAVLTTTALSGLVIGIYAARTAILNLLTSNPITMALAGVSIAIGGLITFLGKQTEEVKKAHSAHDSLAKKMGDVQRAFQTVSDMYGKASAAGKQNADISVEHRRELNNLVNTYPFLHGMIDTTTKKYGGLTTTMRALNAEMTKMSDQNAGNYNNNVDLLEKMKNRRGLGGLKQSFNEKTKAIDDETQYHLDAFDRGHPRGGAAETAERDALKARLTKSANERKLELIQEFRNDPSARALIADMETQRAGAPNYKLADENADPYRLNYSKLVKRPPEKASTGPTDNTSVNPEIETRNGGSHDKPVDVLSLASKFANTVTKEVEAMTTKELENNIKIAIENLKTIDSETEYNAATAKINESYTEYKKRLVAQYTTDKWASIASSLDAEYDEKTHTFIFSKSKQGQLNKAEYLSQRASNPNIFADDVKRGVASKVKESETTGELKSLKIPDFKETATTPYSSRDAEKRADRELETTKKQLAIKKDLAMTAEQVRQIEIETVAAEEKNSTEKLRVFNLEKEELEALAKKGPLMTQQQERLESLKAQIQTTNDLLDEQVRKFKQLSDDTFWSNFKRGVGTANKELGTFSSNTEQLGQTVTSTLENGMVNVIDNTITKIGEMNLTWKSFADGLGNIMKSIASSIQTYIAKLLVLYAVQKLTGFLSGGTSDTVDITNSDTGAVISNTATVSWDGKAEGGMLVGGVANKDSIPILGMPGEIVIKKSSVDYYGADTLLALNDKRLQKFASGGLVGGSSSSSSTAGSSEGTPFTLQVVNVTSSNQIPDSTNATQIINVINADIAKKGPTYQTIKGTFQR